MRFPRSSAPVRFYHKPLRRPLDDAQFSAAFIGPDDERLVHFAPRSRPLDEAIVGSRRENACRAVAAELYVLARAARERDRTVLRSIHRTLRRVFLEDVNPPPAEQGLA
jgi:hypothetical protein